jgi:chromosome segregation ATPase
MKAQIRSLQAIRSMRSTGQRSIPKVQRSTYLDLYMSTKEKERLEKEISNLDRRKQDLQMKLDNVKSRMDELQKPEAARKERASQESEEHSLAKEWKTMSVTY